jgi:hypothetical protein
MASRDEMLEALEQLKMLSGEGMFENKEWGGKKVAPEQPGQNPELTDALTDLSTKLEEKNQRLIKKETGLQEREELLRVEEEKFQRESAQLQAERRAAAAETGRLREKRNNMQEKVLEIRKDEAGVWKEREALDAARETFLGGINSEAQRNFRVFMRLCYDDIRDMISTPRKLCCLIPPETTEWFKQTFQNAGLTTTSTVNVWHGENMRQILLGLNGDLDIKTGDNLCVDIKEGSERIVIFYLKSRLVAYAEEHYGGNQALAEQSLHKPQAGEKYTVKGRRSVISVPICQRLADQASFLR